jgi:hypothetical protein
MIAIFNKSDEVLYFDILNIGTLGLRLVHLPIEEGVDWLINRSESSCMNRERCLFFANKERKLTRLNDSVSSLRVEMRNSNWVTYCSNEGAMLRDEKRSYGADESDNFGCYLAGFRVMDSMKGNRSAGPLIQIVL